MSHADLATIRHYHRLSKHLPERYAPGPGQLDWKNQPNPFRRFAGSPLLPLPMARHGGLRYRQLYTPATAPQALTLEALGALLELGLGLSAWKEIDGSRWALRNNPSSGNLHPTEGYVVLLQALSPDMPAGVYHYAPHEHTLEQRAIFGAAAIAELQALLPGIPALLGLSSVHWREAWKYGERAFRYCQHDVGHATAALAFAARTVDWPLHLLYGADDNAIAALLGLDRNADFADAEHEAPDLLLALGGDPDDYPERLGISHLQAVLADSRWQGQANQLSPQHVAWHALQQVAEASQQMGGWPTVRLPAAVAAEAASTDDNPDAVMTIRLRRSAVSMDGSSRLTQSQFRELLQRLMPADTPPWQALPLPPAVSLLLFVHHVQDLAPGLYLLARGKHHAERLQQQLRTPHLGWQAVPGYNVPLFCLSHNTDWRDAAQLVSCRQEIAADGALAVAMLADFDATLSDIGPGAYRSLFWECGLLGQILYLQAEAAGLSGTGIGCFYDDLLHRIIGLDLEEEQWQSLYHFTIGGREEDRRLRSSAAYAHLQR